MKISKTDGYNPVPTAHVTVNKNRVKIYESKNYYLKNGQTFEIELFNPTTTKVKAEITLSGSNISSTGLILRPGERVYLERFLDSNNKFLFETYEVEDTAEVKTAIKNNGTLEIKFYKEYQVTTLTTSNSIYWANNLNTTNNIQYYSSNVVPDNNFTFTSTNGTTLNRCFNPNTVTSSNIFQPDQTVGAVFTSAEDMVNQTNATTLETGRVEKGEASDQTFEYSTASFNYYAFETVTYNILPLSHQPITKETLTEVKRYCTECGSKTKPTFKFCPVCGEKQ